MTLSRRELFAAAVRPVAAGVVLAALDAAGARRALAAVAGRDGKPEELAGDESYWFEVQQAFRVDRSIVNLNNGGVSPSPGVVLDAQRRHVEYSNEAPAYTMWQVLEPQREPVRQRLAAAFGCDPEEMALVRNASEGLEICQLGFDFEPGDEVVTSTQDYPRMITTFRQLERRRGIVLRQFALPVPAEDADEVVALYEQNLGPRTRLLLVSHMINLTGQILPVRRIVEAARRRGVPVVVDGAHAFAHFPFAHADLDCDYYATSLHKWLFAPHGTGMLYVRREKIRALWPMMAAPPELDGDIRKFEEIGTHPAAPYLAIAEALTFHQGIGPERKAARLVYLRDRWAKRLAAHSKARLHTSLKPGLACGLANVEAVGIEPAALADHLWKRHRILVTPIVHPEFQGLRVTPSVYTTLEEIDRFVGAMEAALDQGLPKA
jgi:selenocysteine lyase/cysteine desulfurase